MGAPLTNLSPDAPRVCRFALVVLLLGAAGAVAACPDADQRALAWLNKMSHSLHETSYEGVVTLLRDSEMQVMQVSHTVNGGHRSEVLTELTGTGAQVTRHAHPLGCVHPGPKLLRSVAPGANGHCGIAAHYRISVSDGERVAGRDAVRMRVDPRDMYRFGYVFTLDRETGLPLKAMTLSQGSQTLEVMQFAHVSYSDPVPAASPVDTVHEAQHPGPGVSAAPYSVAHAWSVGWLPQGFTATDQTPGTGGRRTYTDGLAVFSVFLEELDQEIRPGEGLVRQGGTTTYTRGMRVSGRPVLVTVIGEVPVNTARMVADSVRWVH